MGDQVQDKSKIDQGFQVIHQELLTLQRTQAATAAQVERIQRSVRLDEKEFAVGQQQSNRELINTVGQLARSVNALVRQQRSEQERDEEDGRKIRGMNFDLRQREINRNIARIRYLSTCRQVTVPRCTCGKHKGISFVDDNTGETVVANMCPQAWWVSRSRLAFEDGKLPEFNKKYDLKKFLSMYQI